MAKRVFSLFGLQVSRSWNTPVGDVQTFLLDVKQRGLQATHVLDIGAFEGWFSGQMLFLYPDAALYLIEPLEAKHTYMQEFCLKHKKARHFKYRARSNNALQMLRLADDLACSSLLEVQSKNENLQQVAVRTIDSLVQEREIQVPQIMKIDVQGYELEVLKGAQELFGKTELFIIEVSLQKKMNTSR